MKRVALAFATLAFAASLHAAETPRHGSTDSRVRFVDYDPVQVYELTGVFRSALQIVFADGEIVDHVAVGDSLSWEVAPADNILFVKPRDRAGPTNLIVTTRRRDGVVRSYQFAMVSRGGSIAAGTRGTTFQVRFRYPQDEALARERGELQAKVVSAAVVEAKAVGLALEAAVVAGPRNLDYAVAGSIDLQPSEVTDNGQYTVMRFPRHEAIPAIFVVGPDGGESVVGYDVRGDFVVIHKVARQFCLRRGKLLTCIYNNAFDRFGGDLSTGTASPDVERRIEPKAPQ